MSWDRLIPTSATPGTVTGDDFMDAVQAEITGLADNSNLELTNIDGTADAITADLVPALTAGLIRNMKFVLVPAADNTDAVTISINGGADIDIVDDAGNPLGPGVLKSGVSSQLWSDGSKLRLMGSSVASVIRNRQVFDEDGTWTKPANADPDGVVIIEAWGQGGGGGDDTAIQEGGAGAYRFYHFFRTGDLPSTLDVTVGSGDNTGQDGADTVVSKSGTDYAIAPGGEHGGAQSPGEGGAGTSYRGTALGDRGGSDGDDATHVVGNAGAPGGSGFRLGENTGSNGGDAEYGGAGGGGGTAGELGGTSKYGGNGGDEGLPGERPGGGGGGNASGGGGRAILTTLA